MHTKGPWRIDRHGEIVSNRGRRIATLQAHGDHRILLSEDVANGELMAQAPAMADAIREALALIETFEIAAGVNMLVTKNVLRAPLAKIDGKGEL